MRDKAYHDRELKLVRKQLEDLKHATRQDKAEAKRELVRCWMEYPHAYGERIGWLLNGTYGYGAMVEALKIADNKRLNRIAGLSQLVAALEWQCTAEVTRSAFLALTADKQTEINNIVQAELDYFDANREEFEP